ncbi:hypothetical protein AAMO2058_000322700 [Amorphochlora amoebiformis]
MSPLRTLRVFPIAVSAMIVTQATKVKLNGRAVNVVGSHTSYIFGKDPANIVRLSPSGKPYECHSLQFSFESCGLYLRGYGVENQNNPQFKNGLQGSMMSTQEDGGRSQENRSQRDALESESTIAGLRQSKAKTMSFLLGELFGGPSDGPTPKARQLKTLILEGAHVDGGSVKVIRGGTQGNKRVITLSLKSDTLLRLIHLAEKGVGMKEALTIITSARSVFDDTMNPMDDNDLGRF